MGRPTQYARTSDGVRIAFTAMGQGKPFIEMPAIPFGFSAGHSRIPEWREWNEQMARRWMFIRYDCRGAGMSDRDAVDYSLDGWVRDLEAVVDTLGLDQLTLFGSTGLAAPVAISYAVRHPERVSHLILWQANTRTAHFTDNSGFAAILDLMDKDWEMFSETFAHVVEGWSEPEAARREASLIRENLTPQGLRAAFLASVGVDVTDLLSQVQAPTLVLHRREGRHPLRASQQVASQIPDCRLVVVEGSSTSWSLQYPEAVMQAINDFAEPDATPMTPAGLTPRERDVLRLIAAGKSNRQIAQDLVISVNTADRHVSNIMAKTGASNRAEAASFAVRNGLA